MYAEIRYEDDSGPQLYLMTQDEISVGRGGDGAQVSLALYTNDEVSREHLRVRRDAAGKRFVIVDKSMNGTWLNGKRLVRGVEETLPAEGADQRGGSDHAAVRGADMRIPISRIFRSCSYSWCSRCLRGDA